LPVRGARSIIGRAILGTQINCALLAVNLWECPLQLLPIALPLLIGCRHRLGAAHRVHHRQPRMRQPIVERVDCTPEEAHTSFDLSAFASQLTQLQNVSV